MIGCEEHLWILIYINQKLLIHWQGRLYKTYKDLDIK